MPKGTKCSNALISKGLIKKWNFVKREKVPFFVPKKNYLFTTIALLEAEEYLQSSYSSLYNTPLWIQRINGPNGIRTRVTDVRVPSVAFFTDSHWVIYNE